MKVSIIVPVYNGEKYINRCITSLTNQTHKNIEIIVIDDGSTDNSFEKCSELAQEDNRIKIIRQQNSGVSIARNNGINSADGEYITFVDADDWLEENSIEKMIEIIETTNSDVVRTNYYIDYEDNYSKKSIIITEKKYNKNEIKNNLINNFLTGKYGCYLWLLLIKKNILTDNKIYFEEKIPMLEDKLFYIDLLNKIDNIYMSNQYTYHYFQNQSSVTHNIEKTQNKIDSIIKVNSLITKILKDKNYSSNIIKVSNTSNLLLIIVLIYSLYCNNHKKTKEIYEELHRDNLIKEMKKNISYEKLSKNQKVLVFIFKHNLYFLLKIYFELKKMQTKMVSK